MEFECKKINVEGRDIYVTLNKLAIPESVQVFLLNERILPTKFNIFGHPGFSYEQIQMMKCKMHEYERKIGTSGLSCEVEVLYQEQEFDVSTENFDTVRGIQRSLKRLSDFNEVVKNRKKFVKVYGEDSLSEFVIFGHIHLSKNGEISSIRNRPWIGKDEVEICNASYFDKTDYVIPENDKMVCPCCGNKFTIEDLKNVHCIERDGKIFHKNCWEDYIKKLEIDSLTRMMDFYYPRWTYEVLYHSIDLIRLVFYTNDGDIEIERMCREIVIKWQRNYTNFQMEEIFSGEETTKEEKDGVNFIYAEDEKKATEYLKRVFSVIHPEYEL